jgi:hypothetical protein
MDYSTKFENGGCWATYEEGALRQQIRANFLLVVGQPASPKRLQQIAQSSCAIRTEES